MDHDWRNATLVAGKGAKPAWGQRCVMCQWGSLVDRRQNLGLLVVSRSSVAFLARGISICPAGCPSQSSGRGSNTEMGTVQSYPACVCPRGFSSVDHTATGGLVCFFVFFFLQLLILEIKMGFQNQPTSQPTLSKLAHLG